MDGPLAGATVFACLFSSALAGVAAHARLPGRLRPLLARGVVRWLVLGLAALAGLMLVSLTLSQKARFDRAGRDVQIFAASLVQLDQAARAAGPAGVAMRASLFRYTVNTIQALWPERGLPEWVPEADADEALRQMRREVARLPRDGSAARGRAEALAEALGQAEQAGSRVRAQAQGRVSPYLTGAALIWLMLTFAGFGLWTRPARPAAEGARAEGGRAEGTRAGVLAALFLGALVLGGSIFLMREYSDPFDGVIVVSHEPLQNALFEISE